MSAYLCDPEHLSAIINATRRTAHFRDFRTLERYLTDASAQTVRDGLNSVHEALYSDLMQTNLDSLAARYPENTHLSNWTSAPGRYHYSSRPQYPTSIEAIKGAECYAYQACQHEGWKASKVAQFIEHLISELIATLPGYDKAAWGYEAPKTSASEG